MEKAETINKSFLDIPVDGTGFLRFLLVNFHEFVQLHQPHLAEVNHKIVKFHEHDVIVVLVGLQVIAVELSKVEKVQIRAQNAS